MAVLLCVCICCETAQEQDGGLAYSVSDLRLTGDDVSGWSERGGAVGCTGWGVYDATNVTGDSPINGDAQKYVDLGGVQEFAIQYLSAPAPSGGGELSYDVYLINYATEAKAAQAFEEFRENASIALSGFSPGSALALMDGFGCRVYAYFGFFYIEIRLNNYPDPSQSLDDAAEFLRVYRRKISGV